jgi:integrase/predicted DNA-binding transcriptional regulator AlpA
VNGERIKLTRRSVESQAPAEHGDLFLWDSEVLGFGVKISPAGRRSYVLQYRFGGRARRFTIGAHGSPWTPDTARDQAKILMGQISAGEDPQEAKLGARREMTVAELCDLYLAEGLATRKSTSITSARSDIENHIKPLLGSKRASLVSRQDVDRLLLDVAAGKTAKRAKTDKRRGLSQVRGGRGAANAAVVTLSAAFGFAVARKVRPDNPAFRVRRFPERKIERFLSPAELARLGEAISAAEALGVESASALAAIRLLVLTGCRKSEILTLRRAHVDIHHRCLRLPDSKTGAKVVHVGAAAIKVIEAIPEAPGNPFLLPGWNGQGALVNLQSVWKRIRKAAGLEDVRLHDLRHAFASLGVAGGDSLVIVGALLGHRSAKTTERYAHLAEHPVKDAANRISREVARLMGDDGAVAEPSEAGVSAIDEASLAPFASILGQARQTRWLDVTTTAARLGVKVSTLHTYRWLGNGPACRKIGRRVVYALEDVDAWAATRKPADVSEEASPAMPVRSAPA